MPRLEAPKAGGYSTGGGWNVLWKALGAVLLITCSIGYGVYQYERFFPKKKPAAAAGTAAEKKNKLTSLEKLDLSPEQRRKLAAIDSMSTDSRSKKREAARVLTADQKKQLSELRAQKDKKAQEQAQQRQAKYYPNAASAAYAKQAQETMREERKARKKAAEQAPPPASGT